ncbi:hypothetical protein F4809DRAFT_252098 [Biscogniauxia mediterranea]|nr:hypothetical protein F4809DRAFT_252098 [Biscogniauxia mediterranea]
MAYNQQQSMPTSDELAALFSRNMTFQQLQPQPQAQEPTPEPEEEPVITYSISQHYHHSAHIARQEDDDDMAVPPQPRPSSEPPQSQEPPAEQILRHHGVDPAALSAAQLQLFKTADDGQKQRLVELWRICPPAAPVPAAPAVLALSSTTLEQEELLAQLRYEQRLLEAEEQQQQQQQQQGDMMMSLDGTPLTPVQTAEGRWAVVAVSSSPYYGEPYMLSGYEELARRDYDESARRQYDEEEAAAAAVAAHPPKDVYSHFGYRPATDPVYGGNAWALHQLQQQQQQQQKQQQQQQQQEAMENQYGAFQQMSGGMEF